MPKYHFFAVFHFHYCWLLSALAKHTKDIEEQCAKEKVSEFSC